MLNNNNNKKNNIIIKIVGYYINVPLNKINIYGNKYKNEIQKVHYSQSYVILKDIVKECILVKKCILVLLRSRSY